MVSILSKKRKLVADGVFYAELNEFFTRELAEQGYAGVEVRKTPTKLEVIVKASNTQGVLGEQGRRIHELTSLIVKRFRLSPEGIVIYAERVEERGLSAAVQAEGLKSKLLAGMPLRRAAYGVLRHTMASGAKGVEVVISGKLRAARAKSQKYSDGFMIHSGQPTKDFIDTAIRHVLMRQGVLGIKVKIMKDPAQNKRGPKSLPDAVKIAEAKDEDEIIPAPTVRIHRAAAAAPAEEAEAEAAA
ncbi:40S ribosomal protein S3 [Scheffersomyces spartinae]|uniref:Small ribosomal subunit protein uS3 n=1 Tax=Scheffersomyces spartinae TaxID=45513 RepID=A0A9P7VAW4_9ASCO|nr:40S ribosomal protein S3 [Scheffersomyces spartinae]KAG7194211.1 40S ribosomal protein S3 [Scheffersomyces spartinae]